jgi:hypothetical protein
MITKSTNTDKFPVSGYRSKERLIILFLVFFTSMFFLLLGGCKNNPSDADTDDENIPEETETAVLDDGEVGLVIDTRPIARKGYQPTTASVEFTGEYSEFSQDLTVNPNTSVATLTIAAEEVSEEQKTQMAEGIEGRVTILNDTSEELASVEDQFKVDSSNRFIPVETDKARIYPEVSIVDGEPYILQVKSDNSDYNDHLVFSSDYASPYNFTFEFSGATYCDRDTYHGALIGDSHKENGVKMDLNAFYFEHISGDYYYIYIKAYDNKKYLKKSTAEGKQLVFVDSDDPIDEDPFKFKVQREDNGLVTIISKSKGKALGRPHVGYPEHQPCEYTQGEPIEYYGQLGIARSDEDIFKFRMVAADIDWDVEQRDIEYNAPIVPPAQLDFAYESTLKNCSGGTTLEETVGKTETEENSFTMGTTESLQLYSSSSASIDVTTGMEAGVEMFGASVTASFEVSSSYTYTTSSTQTRSRTWEETTTQTVEVSSERTVTVEPNTAVKVSDAYQTVENINMPFVQILRVTGKDNSGNALTGTEIHSQLIASSFGGVIRKVEDDYVELTVRGTATIDKFVQAERWVEEIEDGCES